MLGLEVTVEDHTLTVSREFCLFYKYTIRNIIQVSILEHLLCMVIKTCSFLFFTGNYLKIFNYIFLYDSRLCFYYH